MSWDHEKDEKKPPRDSSMAAADFRDERMQPPKGIGAEPDHVPPLRPELHIVATNVPIDADLLSAMPPDQREWLAKMGMSGRFDLDGNVTTAANPQAARSISISTSSFTTARCGRRGNVCGFEPERLDAAHARARSCSNRWRASGAMPIYPRAAR